MPEDLPLDGAHWRFAVELYSQPGVSRACLYLQDRLAVDVNILLLVLFARRRHGLCLTRADIEQADDLIRPWRQEVVIRLREVRTRLKQGPVPAPSPETESLRSEVKKAELQSERIQQAVLAQWLAGFEPDARLGREGPGVLVEAVLAHFARTKGVSDDVLDEAEIRGCIDTICGGYDAVKW